MIDFIYHFIIDSFLSGFIAQLVRASHRNREVTGSNPVEVLKIFRLLYAIAKIALITAKIIASLDRIFLCSEMKLEFLSSIVIK